MMYRVKANYRRRPKKGGLCGHIVWEENVWAASLQSAVSTFEKATHYTRNGWQMRPHRIHVTGVWEA